MRIKRPNICKYRIWNASALLFLLLQMSFWGHSKTLIVCADCTINDFAKAVAFASPYDTIVVKEGVYPASEITISKPLTIMGEKEAILDGKLKSHILKIVADSISVSGLTFRNSGRSYTKDFAAIYVSQSKHFLLIDNIILNPFFGILIEKSSYGQVIDNVIKGVSKREDDAGNGIHMWHCNHLLIQHNQVSGLRDGIYLEFVDESVITDNRSENNIRYGLHFMFSNKDKYSKNFFSKNGAGVAVMFSKYIHMTENIFSHNWGTASYGLLLKEIYDAEVEKNVFEENTIGIFVEGSTRINYKNNKFISNGWALKVSGGCYSNHFLANNFIANSFDVSYNSKMNDNLFEGNFWSDYSGYDLDKDGIGDVPYRPVKLFSYVVNQTPETIVLLRSLFIDILNFSEKVSPIFTPDNLVDDKPLIHPAP